MDTPELFPGEREVREMAAQAGWSPAIGNGLALLFESPYDDGVTLGAYASFFEEGVTPAFLLVETLQGDPARAPLGLQIWVAAQGGRVPTLEGGGLFWASAGSSAGLGSSCPRTLRWRRRVGKRNVGVAPNKARPLLIQMSEVLRSGPGGIPHSV